MADEGTTFAKRVALEGAACQGARRAVGARMRDRPSGAPELAYFGPDFADPAYRRRVAQWHHAGFAVLALAFSRNAAASGAEANALRLGRIAARTRVRRLLPMAMAALRLFLNRSRLKEAEAYLARNLDNALLALFARWVAGSSAPFVYEILDVNASATGHGPWGAVIRRAERWVLARAALLVVSSPFFASSYFEPELGYRGPWFLFENKVPKYGAPPRLARSPLAAGRGRPWRIGWFGYLDDEESWRILSRLARALPHAVSVYVRGMPYTNFDMKAFLRDVEELDNATYGGPYRNPENIAEMYAAVDMVWSADCNALAANSKWLLTNSIYEAGYFGTPVIGLAGTAVGEFIERHNAGWSVAAPIDEALIALIGGLAIEQYQEKCRHIAALPPDRFVETDEVATIWSRMRDERARSLLPPRIDDEEETAGEKPLPLG